jgi:hypothetical protein
MMRPPTVAAVALLVAAGPARADMMAPAPIPDRVARAGCIVVGKVTGFTDRLVAANPYYAPTGPRADHQVAVVEVQSVLLGDKALKTLKVGFVPAGTRRAAYFNLAAGEEALYFLTPHPDGEFFVLPMYYDRRVRNPRADSGFDKDVELTQRCVRLLADPEAGLKARDAGDRLLTAGMLLTRYRTRPPGVKLRTEPIPAEQSKLILRTLAEADWDEAGRSGREMGPQELFVKLGLTENDGWKAPGDATQFAAAAKKWLKDNSDKYRIQRLVRDEKKD